MAKRGPKPRITESQKVQILNEYAAGVSQRKLAKRYNISQTLICFILQKQEDYEPRMWYEREAVEIDGRIHYFGKKMATIYKAIEKEPVSSLRTIYHMIADEEGVTEKYVRDAVTLLEKRGYVASEYIGRERFVYPANKPKKILTGIIRPEK